MDEHTIAVTATLSIKTCSCGSVFAIPNWVSAYRCPMCAQRKWERQNIENEELKAEIRRLTRANAALRGFMKKGRK